MRSLRAKLLLAVLLVFAALAPALAQTETRARLEQARATLDRMEQTLQSPGVDQVALQELRDQIDPLMDQLRETAAALEPAAKEIEDRLKELGDAPEGGTEDPAIARNRQETQARFAALDADLKQARFLSVRAGQLSERLADRRRELLTRQLFEKSASLLDPALWRDVGQTAPRFVSGIGFFVEDWVAVLGATGTTFGFALVAATCVLAIVVYGPIRRRLVAAPFGGRIDPKSIDKPTAIQRSLIAAWTALVNALLPVVAAFVVVRVLGALGLVPSRFGTVAHAVVVAFAIFYGLRAVASALLAPSRPAWRFLPLSDAVAGRALRTATWIGGVVAAFHVLQSVNAAILAPLPATVAFLGVRCLVFSAVLAFGLAAGAHLESLEREARAKDPYAAPEERSVAWSWLRLALWIVALAVAAAALAGYPAFGAFLSGQVVWSLIFLGALKILSSLVDDVLSESTRVGTNGSRRLAGTFGVEQTAVEQIGIVVSGVARVLLIVVAIFALVAPWGIESRDAWSAVRSVFFGVQVGGITISLAAILVAAGIFVVGLLATRGAQRWLDDRFLPSTRMDVGLRNSVRTIFGYLGFVVAAMIGFAFLGVDLSSLAIVAGALSVGIGFGLQSIVQNFVSGLILLAERPIKAGDWIVVGDSEGYVKRINVRATEIETFDKAILIVPNASLVSGTVKNWMHNDLFGRTKVKLGVPHGTDPERVRAILVAIARAHPLVTSDPEPRASLVDLNESALHFELAFTVVNVDKSAGVRSDVRFEIVKRLAAEGIAIK